VRSGCYTRSKVTRFLAILALILAAMAVTGFQKEPIPPFEGQDDYGSNRPAWCQNGSDAQHDANCHCKAMNKEECEPVPQGDVPESSKCSTFCRKSDCRCSDHCTS